MLYVFALILALHSSNVLGYGSAKEGKCPPLPVDVNCAFKLINSESESIPCYGQDIECLGDMKCCDDGCGGYECKPAIGLPPLPVIEPHCISAEVRVADQCEPANITYCYADRCNSCCVHNSVCNPTSKHISLEECKEKLCHGIKCPGQGEICIMDKYHRAVCTCPTECPPDTPNMPVCGSDGITYKNECEMNMTACVTGDWIRIVNKGSCQKSPLEICSMPKDKGFGWTLELRYYFNQKKGICEGFIFHGKGGNVNNFEKYKDCVNKCSGTVSNVCVLPKLVGPCRAAFPRWHFNSKVRRCERFIYGGCAGNGNNFESKEECNNECVCNLPKAPGICLGYFPSWFYNSETERCEEFIYGGCHGNANRFYSKERCQNSCGGGAVDLFKPRCHGRGKFNCRSIKKCLPITKKCNGVNDCGDNSDEEGCDPCADKECDFFSTCVTTKNNTARCDCPAICTADWNPICSSDNETYPNLCTMQVASCKRQQLITEVSDGECGGRPRTTCEIHRDEQQSQMLVGVYIPQCEEDGSYSSKQCHGSTGYCWCVDGEGNKLVGTQAEPGQKLNCSGGPLPTDPPFNICDITICKFGRCVEVDGNATCQCYEICPEIYDPVCGTNNKTYPNPCVMDAEACQKEEFIRIQYSGECTETSPGGPLPTDPPVNVCDNTVCEFGRCVEVDGNATCQCQQICPLMYDLVCGTNNKTYVNPCVMDAEACEKKEHIQKQYSGECQMSPPTEGPLPTDPPFNICDNILCEFGRCVEVDGNATCECNNACPLIYDPVCGTNNKTYPNLCVMDLEACKEKELVQTQYSGECKETIDVENVIKNPCQDFECKYYAVCIPLMNGSRLCECPQICTRELDLVCGSDNLTYSNPCEMRVASCEKQELITKTYSGRCGVKIISGGPLSKCEKERAAAIQNGPLLLGTFIPQCEEDGSYSEVQCHGSTGYCWCVDSEGNKRLETKVGPGLTPNCTTEMRPKTKCEKKRTASENGPLLIGAFIPQCEEDGSYSEVQCHGSTGYCWCVDGEGNKRLETEVRPGLRPNCTKEMRPKTKCEKEKAARENGPLLIGAFIPQCEEDGSYSEVQCHGSTGYCWCVDGEGNKRLETEVGPGFRPNCTEELQSTNPPLDPCDISLCDFGVCVSENGTAKCVCNQACPLIEQPVCGSDNKTYANLCVMDAEACERKTYIKAKHNGPCGTKSKCQKELEMTLARQQPGTFIPSCEEDGRYSPKQCHTSTGYCWCATPQGEKILETQLRFKDPDCSTNMKPDPCASVECDFYGTCVALDNGDHICDCPRFCTKEYVPVCASNGKTYGNLCEMQVASCAMQQMLFVESNGDCGSPTTTAPPFNPCDISFCDFGVCVNENGTATCVCNQACPFIEQPVCGSDNKTYANLCVMDSEACERKERITVQNDGPCEEAVPTAGNNPCALIECPFYSECELFNGNAKCVCAAGCTRELDPKCGSDNITYDNPCELRRASCEAKKDITIVKDGECIVPTTASPTAAITKRPPKCNNCPKFGEENVVNSFCEWYNKFAIIGEVLNTSKNGREITVKVETKFKPIAEKTKFIPKNTVRIRVQKISNCQCDNLEFKKNERYVFMGKKTKKRTFVIKWKTGFVEKVSKPLVQKLNKSLQRLKTWGFCVQRRSG